MLHAGKRRRNRKEVDARRFYVIIRMYKSLRVEVQFLTAAMVLVAERFTRNAFFYVIISLVLKTGEVL